MRKWVRFSGEGASANGWSPSGGAVGGTDCDDVSWGREKEIVRLWARIAQLSVKCDILPARRREPVPVAVCSLQYYSSSVRCRYGTLFQSIQPRHGGITNPKLIRLWSTAGGAPLSAHSVDLILHSLFIAAEAQSLHENVILPKNHNRLVSRLCA